MVANHSDPKECVSDFTVGMRVRIAPGQIGETGGIVVEDFGDDVGIPVVIGTTEIAGPARRWAVVLDSGELKCLDSDQLAAVRP